MKGAGHRGEVLWRPDPFSNEWFRHAVMKVTAKSVIVSYGRLDAEPRPVSALFGVRTVRVRKADLDRKGFVHSSTFQGHLYNEAGKAQEIAWRLDPARRYAHDTQQAHFSIPCAEVTPDAFLWPSTGAEIRRRFRELAKKMHPDVGGDAAAFVVLNRSYQRALAMAGAS